MPYLCTHLAFSDRVAKALGQSLEQMGDAYVLGCFGPDVYFFDRLPPTPFVPHRKKFGNALHAQDCAVLFDAMIDAAAPQDEPYLLGFLTHIALDSTLHPYVEAHQSGLNHTRFEGVIDSIVYAETKDRIPYRAILNQRSDAASVDALLQAVSERLQLADVRGAYLRSIRKFRRLMPFLFDPDGKRYRAIRRLERLIRKDGLLSAFLLAAPREDRDDAMNLKKHTWVCPFLPGGTRRESVPELFDEAERFALRLIDAYRSGDRDTLRFLLKDRTMQKGALV